MNINPNEIDTKAKKVFNDLQSKKEKVFVMKEKTPLPKKTSIPLKSTLEKLHSSWVKEMLSGKNVPKKPKEK